MSKCSEEVGNLTYCNMTKYLFQNELFTNQTVEYILYTLREDNFYT